MEFDFNGCYAKAMPMLGIEARVYVIGSVIMVNRSFWGQHDYVQKEYMNQIHILQDLKVIMYQYSSELIELESGGLVVDTPGFSSFELEGITCDDLGMYYPEFEEYLEGCRFSHCSHISEPCCAVKEAVEEGYIGEDRYLRYIELYKVLKKQKDNKYRK